MSEARAEVLHEIQVDDAYPSGWALSSIGEVAEVNPSKATLKLEDDDIVSFIPMAAVEPLSNVIDLSATRAFKDVKKNFTRFVEDDVLFAKITPCMENGKVAVAKGLHQGRGCGTTEFHVLRPSHAISSKYLFYFVVRDAFRNDAKRNMSGAVGQQRVPADFVRDAEIPLPPLAEQERIVSKIDELFSDIEAGERALKRARAALARYRKSVLKAAVTGALTVDWREANKDKLQPADKLLARILTARREAWEKSERAKLEGQGKSPKGEEWKKRYTEPASPDRATDVALPNGWSWCAFDQIIIGFLNGLSKKPAEEPPGDRILRISAVRSMAVNANDIRFYRAEKSENVDGYFLEDDDLLFTRYNGSARLVGVCGRFKGKEKTLYPDKIMRARLASPMLTLPAYVELAMNSGASAAHISSNVKTSAGQHGIAGSDVKRTPVPLPPIAEQTEIVSRVEEAFSKADHVGAALDEQERAARALKQSILKAAFQGRLVPQDPNDEPAAKLLERIKKGRK